MGWGVLVLGFAASLGVLAAPGPVEPALGDGPRTAWLALIWAALGGLPPVPRMRPVPLRVVTAVVLSVSLTTLWIDHRAGHAIQWSTLGGLVVVPLLVVAAARSARDATAVGLYAGFWTVLVLLPALLAAVVAWDGAPGGGPDWLVRAAGFSPLTWAYEGGPPRFTPVLVALVLLAAGWLAGNGAETQAGYADTDADAGEPS